MSGYHQLIRRSIEGTLKNWLLCFGWFSVCEILVKLTLYWVVQLNSAGWRLLCAKCMPGKVGKPFNSWPVAMEASKSVIFLPKTKEISGKNGKWQKAEFFGFQTCFPIFFITQVQQTGPKSHLRDFSGLLGPFWWFLACCLRDQKRVSQCKPTQHLPQNSRKFGLKRNFEAIFWPIFVTSH